MKKATHDADQVRPHAPVPPAEVEAPGGYQRPMHWGDRGQGVADSEIAREDA